MLKLLPLLPWLKGETERLLIAAARGSHAQLRAEAMFDDLPDNADLEAIGAVLARADWFQLFTMIDSRVAQYEPWFAQVRQGLLDAITEETGVVFGAQSAGEGAGQVVRGRAVSQVVNVEGPLARARRDPNAPIERPSGPPPLTGAVENVAEESGEIE